MRSKEFIPEDISPYELSKIEQYANTLWKNVGVNLNLLDRHFLERIHRSEHDRGPIHVKELERLFRKEYEEYGEEISKYPIGKEAILTDIQTDLNAPFIINPLQGSNFKLLTPKTVMRNKNFHPHRGERKFVVREQNEVLTEWSSFDPGIRRALVRKGYTYLKQGVDQMAFLEPGTGEVLKIFGTDGSDTSPDQRMFMYWEKHCGAHADNQFLPRYSGWETFVWGPHKHQYFQIRMERLQHLPQEMGDAMVKLTDIMMADPNSDEIIQNVLHAMEDTDNHVYDKVSIKLDNLNTVWVQVCEVEEWIKLMLIVGEPAFRQLCLTIRDLGDIADRNNWTFDLHGSNIMHRSDGIPVIVDPWCV